MGKNIAYKPIGLFFLLLAQTVLVAQNVGIGTSLPSSKLTISGAESTGNGQQVSLKLENVLSYNAWYLRAGAPGTATPAHGFSIADNFGYHFALDSFGRAGFNTLSPRSRVEISENSYLDGLFGAQLLLYENDNDFARLRFSNNLYNAATNNKFWDIAARIGAAGDLTTNASSLNFYLQGTGDILHLSGNGNVGIGTTAPFSKLQVVSDFGNVASFAGPGGMFIGFSEAGAFRGYAGSVGGSANDMDFSTGAGNTIGKVHLALTSNPVLTVAPSAEAGSVGIGIQSPLDKLHVLGTIRSSTLAGNGVRRVVANGNGQVLAVPDTGYVSVPFTAFVKDNESTTSTINRNSSSGVSLSTGATDWLYAPISLPDSSRMLSLTVTYLDNSVAHNLVADLRYIINASFVVFSLANVNTGNTASGTTSQESTVNVPGSLFVNNDDNSYYLRIAPATGSTWAGTTLGIRSIRVKYVSY